MAFLFVQGVASSKQVAHGLEDAVTGYVLSGCFEGQLDLQRHVD